MDCIVKSPLGDGATVHAIGDRISLEYHKYVELSALDAVELAAEYDARLAAAAQVEAVVDAAEAEAQRIVEAAAKAATSGGDAKDDPDAKANIADALAAIAGMNAANAIAAIGNLSTSDELLALHDIESAGKKRATVLAAIEAREGDLSAAKAATSGGDAKESAS